jgi:chromate transporter
MPSRVSLRAIALTFLKIGAVGFGGGVGMLALLRQEVVEKRKWVDDNDLSTAVAMGQMLPGPFVSNYAEFIGYRLAGIKGMAVSVVSLLFPGFILILLLGFLYLRYGELTAVQKSFTGIQPIVAAIVARATLEIGKGSVRDWRTGLIALFSAVALFLRGDVLMVILTCGALGILLFNTCRCKACFTILSLCIMPTVYNLVPTLPALVPKALELALVFFKMGTVIFGGGFAAIPFLQHEVVELRGWLTIREFTLAVALGQLTPGPVAIMSAFIGYRVLGISGALIATVGTFLPSALMLLGLINLYEKIRSNRFVKAFLAGVLPGVVGMLFFSTVLLTRSAITSFVLAVIGICAFVLLWRFHVEPVYLILIGALLGLSLS